jgi:hypothetical protein
MIDTTSRPATRRSSLFALATAALNFAPLESSRVIAKPPSGKRRRKKCVERCQEQVNQCTLVLNLACNAGNDPDGCKASFLPCCDHLATCSAGETLQCILA